MHLTGVAIDISVIFENLFEVFVCNTVHVQRPGLNVCSLKFTPFTLGGKFRLKSRILSLCVVGQQLITVLAAMNLNALITAPVSI